MTRAKQGVLDSIKKSRMEIFMIRINIILSLVGFGGAIFAPSLALAATADSFYCHLTATDTSVTPAKVISDTTGRFDVLRKPDLSSPTARRLTTNASSSATVKLPDGNTMGFSLMYSHMTNEERNVGLQRSCVSHNLCSSATSNPDGSTSGGSCRVSACGVRSDKDGNADGGWKNVGIDSGVPRFDSTGIFPAAFTYQNYSLVWNCEHTATVGGE